MNYVQYVGQKINNWEILEYLGSGKFQRHYFLVRCDCENKSIRKKTLYTIKKHRSCGCMDEVKGGLSASRIYKIWDGMLRRCENEADRYFHNYGGRGIQICDDWHNFFKFREWAINNGYEDNLTLERIDVNGSYTPENCTWIPMSKQARNRTTNKKMTLDDGSEYILCELAEKLGIKRQTLAKRYDKGIRDIDRLGYKGRLKPIKKEG